MAQRRGTHEESETPRELEALSHSPESTLPESQSRLLGALTTATMQRLGAEALCFDEGNQLRNLRSVNDVVLVDQADDCEHHVLPHRHENLDGISLDAARDLAPLLASLPPIERLPVVGGLIVIGRYRPAPSDCRACYRPCEDPRSGPAVAAVADRDAGRYLRKVVALPTNGQLKPRRLGLDA